MNAFLDRELLENFIGSLGLLGPLIFLLLQIFQVVVAPVPGNVLTLVGGALFGFWPGFLLSYLGNIIGSVLGFLLARKAGRAVYRKLFSAAKYEKYMRTIGAGASLSRIKLLLILVILLPFLPSDLMCLAVGLTPLPFKTFLIIVFICRPWGQLAAALLGAHSLSLPLNALIPLAAVMLAVGCVAVYYAPVIERFTFDMMHKLTDRFHKK